MKIIEAMNESYSVVQLISDVGGQLKELRDKLKSDAGAKDLLQSIDSLDKKTAELVAVERQWPPVGVVSVASLNGALGTLLVSVEGSDAAPTAQATSAFATYKQLLDQQMAKWTALKAKDLPALNTMLQQRQLGPLRLKE